MIVLDCPYIEDHTHEFPDDWRFSGPDNLDPRADPRWWPSVYEYWNDRIQIVHVTVTPFCEMEALDNFTLVAEWGLNPTRLSVMHRGQKATMLPWRYDKETDEVWRV